MAFAAAQLSYLVERGLRHDADDAVAEQYAESLSDIERAEFEQLGADDEVTRGGEAGTPGDDDDADAAGTVARTGGDDPDDAGQVTRGQGTQPTQDEIQRVLDADRQRRQEVRGYIRRQAGPDIPRDLVERALDEEWDQARVDREFLQAVRQRPAAVGHDGHVGIISRSHDRDCSLQALQAGLLLRNGFDLTDNMLTRREASAMLRRDACNAGWLTRAATGAAAGNLDANLERSLDMAHRYEHLSLVDICREALRISGRPVPADQGDVIQRAMSTASLTAIFSTSVNMQILQAYLGYEDTTRGWVAEADVNDFKPNDRGRLTKGSGLSKLARGNEAQHITYGDAKESYAISRYAGQFVVDDQDIIDDRFGGIQGHTTHELGELAAEIRPNLVYAILLSNPAMRDSKALFHADHGNLAAAAALSAESLRVAKANMATQTENGRSIQTAMRYLIVPENLEFTARQLVTSAELRNAAQTGAEGTANPHQGRFQVVSDPRLDNGVTDPNSGNTVVGSETRWFGAARGGRNTIEVGYRRGTGRAPRMDSFMLTGGRWGMGWKAYVDIGAKATDWRGLHRSDA